MGRGGAGRSGSHGHPDGRVLGIVIGCHALSVAPCLDSPLHGGKVGGSISNNSNRVVSTTVGCITELKQQAFGDSLSLDLIDELLQYCFCYALIFDPGAGIQAHYRGARVSKGNGRAAVGIVG